MKRFISFFLSCFVFCVLCGSVCAAVPPDVVISVPGVAPGYITGVIDFNYFSGSPLVASTYSTPWSDIFVNGSYAGVLRYNYQSANEIAAEIRSMGNWDADLLAELCEAAGMIDEWNAADDETFESVAFADAKKLGVKIP